VAHSAFADAMAWLIKHSRLLLDATGATRRLPHEGGKVIRL